MSEQLDVYREWLGIKETARPLDYYQIMRLKQFEDNVPKIREHYRKMNAHVRKFATGDYARQSQELLNELATAMLCLTDAQRKREYDASLGREGQAEGQRRSLEEILLANQSVDRDQLQKARSYADAIGLEIRDALVQQKVAPAETVMLAYAESVGLPYIELEDIGIDETLAPRVPPTLARQHSCVPVRIAAEQLLVASPNPLVPDIEEELRLRFEMPVRTVLCTASGINAAVAKYYPRDAVAPAAVPSASSKPASKPAAKKRERAPGSREGKTAQRSKIAFVAFNSVVMLYVLTKSILGGVSMMDTAVAAVLGAIAAGLAFVVMVKMDL